MCFVMALTTRRIWLFSDRSDRAITSRERLESLAKSDFLFEACAVQATVVEALLFFSITSGAIYRTPSEAAKIRKNLNKLPLGGLIQRVQKYELLDPPLTDELETYKDKRNFLVHHYLVELHDFDYQSFLAEGERLIKSLFERTRRQVHKAIKAMNHPEADKFE